MQNCITSTVIWFNIYNLESLFLANPSPLSHWSWNIFESISASKVPPPITSNSTSSTTCILFLNLNFHAWKTSCIIIIIIIKILHYHLLIHPACASGGTPRIRAKASVHTARSSTLGPTSPARCRAVHAANSASATVARRRRAVPSKERVSLSFCTMASWCCRWKTLNTRRRYLNYKLILIFGGLLFSDLLPPNIQTQAIRAW